MNVYSNRQILILIIIKINQQSKLKDHVSEIVSYEQKDLIKLTKEQYENHKNQKVCYICKKEFSAYDEGKNCYKVKN